MVCAVCLADFHLRWMHNDTAQYCPDQPRAVLARHKQQYVISVQVVSSQLARLSDASTATSAADGSLAAACVALEVLFSRKPSSDAGWRPLEAACSAAGGGSARAVSDVLIMLARTGERLYHFDGCKLQVSCANRC